jgi:rhodanese-related sulfurtransferase
MRRTPITLALLLGLAGTLGAAQKHPAVDSRAPETSAARLHRELAQGAKLLVIDVRTQKEYAAGHIPEAVNIPLEELESRIEAMHLPKDTHIVTMCDRGGRSSRAVRELMKWGYQASSFCRLDSWKTQGYKIKTGESKPAKTSRVRLILGACRA